MDKMSPQTKSFIILSLIALFGVCLSLKLWADLIYSPYGMVYKYAAYPVSKSQDASIASVDTSAWETYTNKEYNFNFKYKPGWKVLPATAKNGFTILQVDPGKKYYNIKIYISPKEFYIFDGLPTTSENIGGASALNVHNALYGIIANNLHYTFDVGLSMSLVPEFDALVHSVEFGN